jgi:BolA family transcriptional regulator, general stress-responsive regulator
LYAVSLAAANRWPVTTVQTIEHLLAGLEPESIELVDDSARHAGHAGARAGGGHYELTVVSPRFEGKSRLERHRMVYAALGPLMQREIHALALRTYAPGEL